MKKLVFLIIFFASISQCLYSQAHEDKHHGHNHENRRNEVGLANSLVYFINEEEIAYGLHIHYLYNFSKSKFGAGIFYEKLFDDHKHNSFGIVGTYMVFDDVSISLSPGLKFENNNFKDPGFTIHFETSYEFEINSLHLGPVVECAYDLEDVHLSLGFHLGYLF